MADRLPAVLAAALAGAVLLAISATVLVSLWWFPSAPGQERDLLPPRSATALQVQDLQTAALALVAAVGLATAVVAVVRPPRRCRRRRNRTAPVLAMAVVVLAGAVWATRGLVLWDQVGLRGVTIGLEFDRGTWWAARSDAVRFVIVGNSEVSKATYLGATVVHTVVLPALMLAAAAGAAWLSWLRPSVEHDA